MLSNPMCFSIRFTLPELRTYAERADGHNVCQRYKKAMKSSTGLVHFSAPGTAKFHLLFWYRKSGETACALCTRSFVAFTMPFDTRWDRLHDRRHLTNFYC